MSRLRSAPNAFASLSAILADRPDLPFSKFESATRVTPSRLAAFVMDIPEGMMFSRM